MTLSLTPQQKLALAMTSAGSQRRLAAAMGITHQKLGRWLRVGQQGGSKSIPDDAAPVINEVFKLHRSIAHDQAVVDDMPFEYDLPVFTYRPIMKYGPGAGERGDRFAISHTEFIDEELRKSIFMDLHTSRRVHTASIRSVIDWYEYVTTRKTTGVDKYRPGRDGTLLYKQRDHTTGKTAWVVIDDPRRPKYTTREDFSPGTNSDAAVDAIESKLSVLSPHAIKFADEFSGQLLPKGWRENEQRFDKKQRRNAGGTRSAKSRAKRRR